MHDVEMRAARTFLHSQTRTHLRPGDYYVTDSITAHDHERRGLGEVVERMTPAPANKMRAPVTNKAIPANPPDAGAALPSRSSPAAQASPATMSSGSPIGDEPVPRRKRGRPPTKYRFVESSP